MSYGWTDDRIAETRRLWLAGQSATEIAKAIGGGLSRNAVIGKVHRMGIARDGRAVAAKPVLARPPRAPKVKAAPKVQPPKPGPQNKPGCVFGATFPETRSSHEQRSTARKQGLSVVERVEQGCEVSSPNTRPFLEAKAGCKWPLAGGMVCCNPKARGAYCEGHAAVAFMPRPNKLKNASYVDSTAAYHTRNERLDAYQLRRPANDVRSEWDSGRAAA